MRKLLDWLYPKYDEVTVFLITLIMAVSIPIDPRARGSVMNFFTEAFHKGFMTGTVFVFIALSGIATGLMLPFTKRDLRRTAVIIILFHTLVVNAVNMAAIIDNKDDPVLVLFNFLFLMYSFSWLIVLRYRKAENVISDRQAHPREALYCGAVCIVALLMAIFVLRMPWILAYWFTVMGISKLHNSGLSCIRSFKSAPRSSLDPQMQRPPTE